MASSLIDLQGRVEIAKAKMLRAADRYCIAADTFLADPGGLEQWKKEKETLAAAIDAFNAACEAQWKVATESIHR